MLAEYTVGGLHAHLERLLFLGPIPIRPSSVLDIGCGTGAWLQRLQKYGPENLTGLDAGEPPAEVSFRFIAADLNGRIAADLGRFDLVTCIEVVEHIENLGHLFDLISSSLKPTGVAVITTPNIESLRARLRALLTGRIPSFDDKSDPTHLCPILHASMLKFASRRKLVITAVHNYPPARQASRMFSPSIRWGARLLRPFLPDRWFGDNLIYVLRHC